ncbi:MAG: hypothetical protein B7X39_17580 [Lysobacterales bacterium 14-68-21]|jgi:uncharacterized membrane protein|nr:MAG: hypothetical protein B7X45_16095 [Xanthomonadales bacterium 15-68-25]OZB64044.1 MAG: hypothetical protein B7X39_17580 [Xanthomonadales bacterium 14-68-21]
MNAWPLLGVAVIALGFVLRFNPVLVVVTAAVTSGLLSGMSVPDLLALLGTSFASSRILLIIVMTLPAIGLLERAGLREHARAWMDRLRGMTLARLLVGYLLGRQLLSMIGLQSVAGPAQTVRPLLAPMAEAAAARIDPALPEDERDRLRALCAATDNVGLFFGEDVFIALGAVLLIQGFYSQHGIELTPLSIALWALPSAIAAFAVHSVRIALFQRRLRRLASSRPER